MNYMDIVNFVFIFVLVWWIVIFTILPFGNKTADQKIIGHAGSAPANPRMKQKLIWTTLISLLITGTIFAVVHYTGFTLVGLMKSWQPE